jgi:ATP-dependent exoDNAse (exonuclease V) alpha subunit
MRPQPLAGPNLPQNSLKSAMLFLTGRAGTGKSWATKRIIEDFTKNKKIIFATAPTGIAAINVDGMTLHNWGRFNLGQYCEFVLCY